MKILDAIMKDPPFALYITDNLLQVILLKGDLKSAKLESIGQKALPQGYVQNGQILKKKELCSEIKKLLASTKPLPVKSKKCILVIPENQSFEHVFYYDKKIAPDEITHKLADQIESSIPLTPGQIRYNYTVFDLTNVRVVFSSSADKKYISEYALMLKSFCDLDALIIEPALLGLIRNIPVNFKEDAGNIIIYEKDNLISWSLVWHGNIFDSNLVDQNELISDLELSIKHFENETKRKVKNIHLVHPPVEGSKLVELIGKMAGVPLLKTDQFLVSKPTDSMEMKILSGAGLRALHIDSKEINLA